jgi:hypothetical protein
MFRTDPMTDEGKVDTEFFASAEYVAERECLVKYLYDEGFNLKEEEFVIDFKSRRWHVNPKCSNKKKG